MYLNQLPIFKELNPYDGIDTDNHWVKLAALVPWEKMKQAYMKCFSPCKRDIVKPRRLMLELFMGKLMQPISDDTILEYFLNNLYFNIFVAIKRLRQSEKDSVFVMIHY